IYRQSAEYIIALEDIRQPPPQSYTHSIGLPALGGLDFSFVTCILDNHRHRPCHAPIVAHVRMEYTVETKRDSIFPAFQTRRSRYIAEYSSIHFYIDV